MVIDPQRRHPVYSICEEGNLGLLSDRPWSLGGRQECGPREDRGKRSGSQPQSCRETGRARCRHQHQQGLDSHRSLFGSGRWERCLYPATGTSGHRAQGHCLDRGGVPRLLERGGPPPFLPQGKHGGPSATLTGVGRRAFPRGEPEVGGESRTTRGNDEDQYAGPSLPPGAYAAGWEGIGCQHLPITCGGAVNCFSAHPSVAARPREWSQ